MHAAPSDPPLPLRLAAGARRHALLLTTLALAVFLLGHTIHGHGRTLDDAIRRARGEGMLAWLGGASDAVLPPRVITLQGKDQAEMNRILADLSRGDSLFGSFGSASALFAGRLLAPWIGDPATERWLPYHAGLTLWFLVLFWATGALGARLTGRPALGIAAALLLVAQPRILGLATNNPSDLPAAATTALAVLALARWTERASWPRAFAICLALAMTAAVRPQNAAHVVPVLALGTWLTLRRLRRAARPLPLAQLVMAPFVTYALFILLWPEFWAHPFEGPWQLVRGFLATGERYKQATLWFGALSHGPWLYPVVYFFVTTPELVLLPFFAGLFTRTSHAPLRAMLLLWGALAFGKHLTGLANHGGIRHFLDGYVPVAIFAAAGWALLARPVPARWRAPLVLGAALVAFVLAARQHPYEGSYYNVVSGGPRWAAGKLPLEPMGTLMLPLLRQVAPELQPDDVLLVPGPADLVHQLALPLRDQERQVVEIPGTPALIAAFEAHAAELFAHRRVWLLEIQARAWGRLEPMLAEGLLETRVQLGPSGLPVARAHVILAPDFYARAGEVYEGRPR